MEDILRKLYEIESTASKITDDVLAQKQDLAQLNQIEQLSPYMQINPYKDALAKVTHFVDLLGDTSSVKPEKISLEESLALIESTNEQLSALDAKRSQIESQKADTFTARRTIEPFRKLPFELHEMLHAQYVQNRFGRIAKVF